MRTIFVSLIVLAIVGCERKVEVDRAGKLELIRAAVVRRASIEHREALAAAAIVVGVKDLPSSVVGLRVPVSGSANSNFVTFEVGHFDSRGVEELAAEALIDYTRAVEGGRKGG